MCRRRRREQEVQPSLPIQGIDLVRATKAPTIDEHLWHRTAPTSASDHLFASSGTHPKIDFDELNPLAREEKFRPVAVGAHGRRIDLDQGHRAPAAVAAPLSPWRNTTII